MCRSVATYESFMSLSEARVAIRPNSESGVGSDGFVGKMANAVQTVVQVVLMLVLAVCTKPFQKD